MASPLEELDPESGEFDPGSLLGEVTEGLPLTRRTQQAAANEEVRRAFEQRALLEKLQRLRAITAGLNPAAGEWMNPYASQQNPVNPTPAVDLTQFAIGGDDHAPEDIVRGPNGAYTNVPQDTSSLPMVSQMSEERTWPYSLPSGNRTYTPIVSSASPLTSGGPLIQNLEQLGAVLKKLQGAPEELRTALLSKWTGIPLSGSRAEALAASLVRLHEQNALMEPHRKALEDIRREQMRQSFERSQRRHERSSLQMVQREYDGLSRLQWQIEQGTLSNTPQRVEAMKVYQQELKRVQEFEKTVLGGIKMRQKFAGEASGGAGGSTEAGGASESAAGVPGGRGEEYAVEMGHKKGDEKVSQSGKPIVYDGTKWVYK